MTPEEILRDLRDIHLPEEAAEMTGAVLVLWPLALVVVLALVGCWLVHRRRRAWRLDIRRHLDRIEHEASEGRIMGAWTDLAILLRRIAITLGDRQDVARLVGDGWLETLDRLLETDVFSRGPGRGVAVFPYSGAVPNDPKRPANELKATIDVIRQRLPSLRTAA